MSYQRASGMGYLRMAVVDDECTRHAAGPLARCFPSGEEEIARRMGCAAVGQTTCDYQAGGSWRSGELYCCPRDEAGAAEAPATPAERETAAAKEAQTGWEQAFTYPASLLGQKLEAGAASIGAAAAKVAQTVAPTAAASTIPISETEDDRSALERWTPIITIGSTLIGIGLFAWWIIERRTRPESATANPHSAPKKHHYMIWMQQELYERMWDGTPISYTRLAENAAWHFDEDWRLDDEQDPVWDWAVEAVERFEDEENVRIRPNRIPGREPTRKELWLLTAMDDWHMEAHDHFPFANPLPFEVKYIPDPHDPSDRTYHNVYDRETGEHVGLVYVLTSGSWLARLSPSAGGEYLDQRFDGLFEAARGLHDEWKYGERNPRKGSKPYTIEKVPTPGGPPHVWSVYDKLTGEFAGTVYKLGGGWTGSLFGSTHLWFTRPNRFQAAEVVHGAYEAEMSGRALPEYRPAGLR